LDPRAWYYPAWGAAAAWYGYAGEPVSYGYGETITYEDGNVYYGDQLAATAEQYYAQAGEIAAAGQTSQNEDWLPLGVFSVVKEKGQSDSDKVLQLALNKQGVVRGALYEKLTGKETTITGAVDKKSQRVAVAFEGNNAVVAEMGLYNLTENEVPALVHFGPDRHENRILVRLKQPEGQEQQ
jgi:hypothetical protein